MLSTSSEQEGSQPVKRPRKSDFRQRAHCNPLSDSFIAYPRSPDYVDWSIHYPKYFDGPKHATYGLNTFPHPIDYTLRQPGSLSGLTSARKVDILDIGCGYGGLSFALSKSHPDNLILGMEIREKVTEYTGEKLIALRQEALAAGDDISYQNVAFVRTNVMKFLPNYIRKGQIKKIFFCFPDPQFKRPNWRRRIITLPLLSLYAYVLAPGASVYTVTDVEDLHKWMRAALSAHELFEEVPVEEAEADEEYKKIQYITEEAERVIKLGSSIYATLFRRK